MLIIFVNTGGVSAVFFSHPSYKPLMEQLLFYFDQYSYLLRLCNNPKSLNIGYLQIQRLIKYYTEITTVAF